MALPKTHLALVQETKSAPLTLKSTPTPTATPGSAVLQVLYAPIVSYAREVYNGTRNYAYPVPLTPGSSAIGRIVSTGPDAAKLKKGDLVYFDCSIRGRDDTDAMILAGIHEGGTEGSRTLMAGEWRNGTWAQYARLPLENLYGLDEKRLCGDLGYDVAQLCWILQGLVPYGGLKSIALQAGETVVIAPATGGFGSAAVVVAVAMGARVIAMGRNEGELEKIRKLNPERVRVVRMTGDLDGEVAALKEFGKIDAFFDISPAAAQESTHFRAGILSLARGGRVCLMGGLQGDLAIPHFFVMRFDIQLKGKWMYDREDVFGFLALMETGVVNVKDIVKIKQIFALENWKEALDAAAEYGRLGEMVVFKP